MNRAKDDLVASRITPNCDTFLPIISLLTQQQKHTQVAAMASEMKNHSIVAEEYITLGQGEALSAFAERNAMQECTELLQAITLQSGKGAATKVFTAGLERSAAKGCLSVCEALDTLATTTGIVQHNGKSIVTLADGLSQDINQQGKVHQLYQRALQDLELGEGDFAVMARAFARLGDLSQVKQVLDAIPARGLQLYANCFVPLFSHYSKKKDIVGCEWVLAEMGARNVKRNISILRLQMGLFVALVCFIFFTNSNF